MRPRYAALTALLLLAGCATTAPQPSALARAVVLPSGHCLPPGSTADFLAWPMERTNVVRVATQDGDYRLAVTELFRAPDGRAVRVLWVEGSLVLVDQHPDDPDAAPWIDRGLVSEDDKSLRTPQGQPCQWRPAGERTT